MGKVFCDRLTVTCPVSHDAALRDVAVEYALQLGAVPGGPDGRWGLSEGGSLYYQARSRFAAVEASGQALAALRAAGLFADYLGALGALPHRVTRLDATLDVVTDAAPFVADLYSRGVKGKVHLSRKAVQGSEVVKYLGAPLYSGESLDTGTVYVPMRRFGSKRQYLTVYDKRQETIARGKSDPGPLLRVEASAAREKGATLGDAWDPTALFYDIVSPSVLPRPVGVPEWTPAGDRWSAGPVPEADPRRRLQWALEGPLGVELARLAAYPGGHADIRQWLERVAHGDVPVREAA